MWPAWLDGVRSPEWLRGLTLARTSPGAWVFGRALWRVGLQMVAEHGGWGSEGDVESKLPYGF